MREYLSNVRQEYRETIRRNGVDKFIFLNDSLIAMKAFGLKMRQNTDKTDMEDTYARYVLIKMKNEEEFVCSCMMVESNYTSVIPDTRSGDCPHLIVGKDIILEYRERIRQAKSNPEKDTFKIFTGNRRLWIFAKWEDPHNAPGFAILKKTQCGNISCNVCPLSKRCDHADKVFKCKELEPPTPTPKLRKKKRPGNDSDDDFDEDKQKIKEENLSTFKPVSRNLIIFPYPVEVKQRSDELKNGGYAQMKKLVPPYNPDNKCRRHQLGYSPEDPVANNWIEKRGAHLVVDGMHFRVSVYYRKSKCCSEECKQYYDGGDDFILNLNNEWLFSHSLLLKLPLIQKSCRVTSHGMNLAADALDKFCGQGMWSVGPQALLKAYNSFIRLLHPDTWKIGFECVDCKDAMRKGGRQILLADGLQMGASLYVIYHSFNYKCNKEEKKKQKRIHITIHL